LTLVACTQASLLFSHYAAHPVIVQSNDAGNIAGWIAGRLFPQRFATDFLLSDEGNTAFYKSVFMLLVEGTSRITNDIGLSYIYSYSLMITVEVLGFYLLGLYTSKSKTWACTLALTSITPIFFWGQNDLFGLFYLPLTRNAFDAILPFLILLFLIHGGQSKLLPLLFAVYGLTVYIHPVSAPAGAAGLWFGCFALRRTGERPSLRFLFLVAGGLVFILIATPYALSFFSSFAGGEQMTDAVAHTAQLEAIEAFRRANGPIYYDALLALKSAVSDPGLRVWPVWAGGLVGMLVVPWLEPDRRHLCRFLLLFLIGVLVASFGICLVDQSIARALDRTPFQLDLIRGMRLIVVPLLVGFVSLIAALQRRLEHYPQFAWTKVLAPSVAVLFVGYWWLAFPTLLSDRLGLGHVTQTYLAEDSDAVAIMRYLRARQPAGPILPIGSSTVGLAVRYAGLQPVAFLVNDANALFYSGSKKRFLWTDLYLLNKRMLDWSDQSASQAFEQLVERTQARYVLLEDGVVSADVRSEIVKLGNLEQRIGRWTLFDLAFTR
jgi:hypothetical protein